MSAYLDCEGIEDRTFLFDVLAGQPEGAMERVGPGHYLVMGSKGTSYDVWLGDCRCNCPHHTHRLVPGERCRHLDMAIANLTAQGLDWCPGCQDASPCAWCGGEVMIPKAEAAAVRDYRTQLQDARDRELRKVFA